MLNEPDWIIKNRKKGIALFKKLEEQDTKYLPKDFSFKGAELRDYEKDFFEENYDNKIQVMDIQEAFSKHESLLKEYFGKLLDDKDKVFAFQNAFWNAGVFVYVPPNTVCDVPLSIFSKSSSRPIFSRLFFMIEKNSEITIIETSDKNKESIFYGKAAEVFVGENSKVNYIDVRESKQKTVVNVKRGSLDRNAVLNWFTIEVGESDCFDEVKSMLNGEYSQTKNLSVFFGNKEQKICLDLKSFHNAERTTSMILTKGAVSDISSAELHGLIEIAKNAKNSDGYQKLEALVLNKGAKVNAVPDLLINNNEVKCGHAATIARIDDEKLFYLNSRGISEKTAKKMIVEGFFASVLNEIKNEKMQNEIIKKISYKLEG